MEFSLTLRNCFHISVKRINPLYLYQYEQFEAETKFKSNIKLNLDKFTWRLQWISLIKFKLVWFFYFTTFIYSKVDVYPDQLKWYLIKLYNYSSQLLMPLYTCTWQNDKLFMIIRQMKLASTFPDRGKTWKPAAFVLLIS